jgi:hypothetical protein
MAIHLFGNTNTKSFNTLKIRFALAEIGAAYELCPSTSRRANRVPPIS